MTESKTYAAMLYSIADEIEVEGRVTQACAELNGWTSERIRDAARRMDEQTVVINQLRKDREFMTGVLKLVEQDLISGKSNPLSLADYIGSVLISFRSVEK